MEARVFVRRRLRLAPGAETALGCTAAAASVAVAAIALTVAVRDGAPLGIDLAARDLVAARDGDPGRWAASWLTLLGSGPVLYLVLLTVCLVGCVRRRSPRELLPVLPLHAGQVLELVLFTTLHRPPPTGEAAAAFPTAFSSGHTAAAVVGWGLIAWQSGRLRDRPATPLRWLWTVAVSVGVVVGATRVYLGLHWLTNAAAGLAVGSAFLAVALIGLRRLPAAPALRPPRPPAAPLPAAGSGRARLAHWLRTSRWAWSLPAAAAVVPIAPILLAEPGDRLIDLLVYYGATGTAGAGENVYAFQTVFAMPFTYPPFAALALEPIARMPLGFVQALWTLGTLAAMVGIAVTVLRPVTDRIGLPLTVAAMLISSPVRSHFRFGQVGVFLVLLVSLDLLRRTRSRWQGWGLGLATAIKLTPAVFLPWLALTRQWRRLAATLLWLGGATLAGLVLLWPSSGDYLLRAARDTSRFGANDIPGNQSVRGMLLRLLPDALSGAGATGGAGAQAPDLAATAERMWLLLAVLLVVIGSYQAWRCERYGNRLAAVGVLAAVSVAVSPISWVHHLVWLALPIAALAAAGRFRLVAGWYVLLAVSSEALGTAIGSVAPALVSELARDLQGLTAVAAVLLLPTLVGRTTRAGGTPAENRPGRSREPVPGLRSGRAYS